MAARKSVKKSAKAAAIKVSLSGLELSEPQLASIEKAVRRAVLNELASVDRRAHFRVRPLPASGGEDSIDLAGAVRTIGLYLTGE